MTGLRLPRLPRLQSKRRRWRTLSSPPLNWADYLRLVGDQSIRFTPDELALLTQNGDPVGRARAAADPRTPLPALQALAREVLTGQEPDRQVNAMLQSNPTLPEEVRVMLSLASNTR